MGLRRQKQRKLLHMTAMLYIYYILILEVLSAYFSLFSVAIKYLRLGAL